MVSTKSSGCSDDSPSHWPRPLPRPAGPPQLMYKLRKELGETDFNKIFNNVKVKGFDIEY